MSRRILLCDDETHILRAAEFKLRRAGLDVECVHDGLEAWEAIVRRRPDLLVTDYQMPRLNGLELCRKIRGEPGLPAFPIVLLTAKGYELSEGDLLAELGLTAVLAKPFSPRELLGMVQRELGLPAATATARAVDE